MKLIEKIVPINPDTKFVIQLSGSELNALVATIGCSVHSNYESHASKFDEYKNYPILNSSEFQELFSSLKTLLY